MAADIVEGTHALWGAYHHQRLAEKFEGMKVAGTRYIAQVAHGLPAAAEDRLALAREELRVAINPCGQAVRVRVGGRSVGDTAERSGVHRGASRQGKTLLNDRTATGAGPAIAAAAAGGRGRAWRQANVVQKARTLRGARGPAGLNNTNGANKINGAT